MKDELLKEIESRGFWRIVFHPVEFNENRLTLTGCSKAVERNSVTLRGWDYPHVESGSRGGVEGLGKYCESWTDWGGHLEFWQFYRSGQFLHYRALAEDWQQERSQAIAESLYPLAKELGADASGLVSSDTFIPQEPFQILDVTRVMYLIAEVFEFMRRMAEGLSGIYESGVSLSVTLCNVNNRQLFENDFMRGGKLKYRTSLPKIEIPHTFSEQEVRFDTINKTLGVVMEIYDQFLYTPARDKILTKIEQHLSGTHR